DARLEPGAAFRPAVRASRLQQPGRLHEAPRQTREHQGHPHLHGGEQEWVVVGARIRRRDVAPEIEPVREAAADELRAEREEDERGSRQSPLVPPCPFHAPLRVCAPRGTQVKRTGVPWAPTTVTTHSSAHWSSNARRKIRWYWPRWRRPSEKGICSARGPSSSDTSR